jgi:hypothetical protein
MSVSVKEVVDIIAKSSLNKTKSNKLIYRIKSHVESRAALANTLLAMAPGIQNHENQ